MESSIGITRDADNIVTFTFDSPGKPVNVFSPAMLAELSDALDELDRNKPVALILASAKARSFGAGADLFEVRKLNREQLDAYLSRGQMLFERVAKFPFPTVAAINGDCLGGACEMSLACKWRVVVDDTTINIGLPEVKLGLLPAWGGTTRLPRLLGLRRALPILLAGKVLPPRKALKVGMIDEVVRPEALLAAAHRLARSQPKKRSLSALDCLLASMPAARNRLLDAARRKTLAQTYGNYPMPIELLDVVRIGYDEGHSAGLAAERRAIVKSTASPAGRNLLRLFFLRQAAKKTAMASLHVEANKIVDVKYTAVIGGGTMGTGIAHALARAGLFVRLVEVDAAAMAAGLRRIKQMFTDDIGAGRLDHIAARQAMNRIAPCTNWTGLELADFIVEAVPEVIGLKREVFSKLDRLTRPTAVLASNTSSLRVDEIAQTTLHPERVVGMHFFNPVPKMQLVEIIRASHSDDVSLATAVILAGRLGKTPVLVADSPGFVVNRILVPYLAESLLMAGEGTPITAIDHAMKAWGMPMGPFELLDEIGLDIAAHVLESLQIQAQRPEGATKVFAVANEKRWLGKKTGRGFYLHDAKKPLANDELLNVLTGGYPPLVESTDENIQQRLVLPMVNEAARLLEERVVDSADAIDLATVLGLGLAPFRGGIVQHANSVGSEKIVEQMEKLAALHGPRFAPASLLKKVALDHHPLEALGPRRYWSEKHLCIDRNSRLEKPGRERIMPKLSHADQEQFDKARDLIESEAKELGFVKSLFFGRIRADQILPYPMQDAEEARRTDNLIARLDVFLKADVDADRIDAEERIPQNVIEGLGKLGVLGMTVPVEYGGGGFSHTAYCRVLEHVAKHCASTAVLIGAHQSIGLKALLLAGTDQQKRSFLPALARGDMLAAFCLSEPEVGSDAASVQTSATLSDDGSHWILNGEKRYATNAALAGFMTVMARTSVCENGKMRDKVTAFIVTPDLPGFEVVKSNRSKCGVRGTWQAVLRFTNMQVPADRVLGEIGKGLKVAFSVLNFGRCTLSAGCVGAARQALAMCVERARSRRQFGRSIGEFHLIKQKIAQMAEAVFAMDAVTYLAAGMVDRHVEDLMLETAIAKLFCSENAWQVIDDAVQIWGGEGYMREHGLERMLRDARINRIVEGTSEVMTAFISLVGLKGVGEGLEKVMHLARHPMGNFGRLAQFAKDEWSDVVIGHSIEGLHPTLIGEGRTLARLTKSLARDVIRILSVQRERVLDQELIHQRIAAAAMDLFVMSAVVSKLQYLAENAEQSTDYARDLVVGKSFFNNAAHRVERQLSELFDNHDQAVLATADAVLRLDHGNRS